MNKFESIRLILRPWTLDDLYDLHEIMSNKEVGYLAGFSPRDNLNDSLEILKKFVKEPPNSLWAIEIKGINKVVGWIELHKPIEDICKGSKEIGFVLFKHYWGQGLMAEAIKEVITYAFKEEQIEDIICSHFEGNIQSKRVIEKCGFKYKGKCSGKNYYYLSSTEQGY